MGFLNKSEVASFQREERDAEMKAWAYNYPFGAAVMSGLRLTDDYARELITLGKERRD